MLNKGRMSLDGPHALDDERKRSADFGQKNHWCRRQSLLRRTHCGEYSKDLACISKRRREPCVFSLGLRARGCSRRIDQALEQLTRSGEVHVGYRLGLLSFRLGREGALEVGGGAQCHGLPNQCIEVFGHHRTIARPYPIRTHTRQRLPQ